MDIWKGNELIVVAALHVKTLGLLHPSQLHASCNTLQTSRDASNLNQSFKFLETSGLVCCFFDTTQLSLILVGSTATC